MGLLESGWTHTKERAKDTAKAVVGGAVDAGARVPLVTIGRIVQETATGVWRALSQPVLHTWEAAKDVYTGFRHPISEGIVSKVSEAAGELLIGATRPVTEILNATENVSRVISTGVRDEIEAAVRIAGAGVLTDTSGARHALAPSTKTVEVVTGAEGPARPPQKVPARVAPLFGAGAANDDAEPQQAAA